MASIAEMRALNAEKAEKNATNAQLAEYPRHDTPIADVGKQVETLNRFVDKWGADQNGTYDIRDNPDKKIQGILGKYSDQVKNYDGKESFFIGQYRPHYSSLTFDPNRQMVSPYRYKVIINTANQAQKEVNAYNAARVDALAVSKIKQNNALVAAKAIRAASITKRYSESHPYKSILDGTITDTDKIIIEVVKMRSLADSKFPLKIEVPREDKSKPADNALLDDINEGQNVILYLEQDDVGKWHAYYFTKHSWTEITKRRNPMTGKVEHPTTKREINPNFAIEGVAELQKARGGKQRKLTHKKRKSKRKTHRKRR